MKINMICKCKCATDDNLKNLKFWPLWFLGFLFENLGFFDPISSRGLLTSEGRRWWGSKQAPRRLHSGRSWCTCYRPEL